MDSKTQHGRHAWIQRRSTGGMHGSKDSTQGTCMDPHSTLIESDTQQTQNICMIFIDIFDVGPTLYKSYTNVLRLLGRDIPECMTDSNTNSTHGTCIDPNKKRGIGNRGIGLHDSR